ncbi:MAG: beta-N-acetylhexosaminidase [Capsulimonadaceae bacterium]
MPGNPFAIVPKPAHIKRLEGDLTISAIPMIRASETIRPEKLYLEDELSDLIAPDILIARTNIEHPPCIDLRLDDGAGFEPEGYRLRVDTAGILIEAGTRTGIFRGIHTLLQMLSMPPEGPSFTIPAIEIEDAPRFSWRGAMLDVARHFFPVEFVKRFLDLMAMHKLNVLHLHLSDEQGWRIEIKKWPKLTSIGAIRRETVVGRHDDDARDLVFDGIPYGGFYTQDDAREIVRYAAERHIDVVPEIDIPGHTRAAIAAYPELGCTGRAVDVRTSWGRGDDILNPSEVTFAFLEDVFTELIDIFPSRFIHVGGDEVIKSIWRKNPAVQKRMRALGLPDEDKLQSYFIQHMDAFLTGRGRRLVGWDEILDGGLAAGATVMNWRGVDAAIDAATAGHDVVMAPTSHTYFDYYQSKDTAAEPPALGGFLPLEKVYEFEPIPAALPASFAGHILGAQAQHWSEYIPTPAQLEYMAFPRLCALAEVVWSPAESRSYPDFLDRLRVHLTRLEALGVNYRRDPAV